MGIEPRGSPVLAPPSWKPEVGLVPVDTLGSGRGPIECEESQGAEQGQELVTGAPWGRTPREDIGRLGAFRRQRALANLPNFSSCSVLGSLH